MSLINEARVAILFVTDYTKLNCLLYYVRLLATQEKNFYTAFLAIVATFSMEVCILQW